MTQIKLPEIGKSCNPLHTRQPEMRESQCLHIALPIALLQPTLEHLAILPQHLLSDIRNRLGTLFYLQLGQLLIVDDLDRLHIPANKQLEAVAGEGVEHEVELAELAVEVEDAQGFEGGELVVGQVEAGELTEGC
jgi:hypothetical protein